MLLWFLEKLHKPRYSDDRHIRYKVGATQKDWALLKNSIQYEETIKEYRRIIRVLTTGKMRTMWYLKPRNHKEYMERARASKKRYLQKRKSMV